MDSLEEKVFVFMDEDCSSNRSLDDYKLEDGSDSQETAERTLYWASQEALLQEILEHYNLTGSHLRQEVGRIIKMGKESDFCDCLKPNFFACPYCLRRRVIHLLCDKGFKAAVCISKWRTTKKCPGGKYEYIEVIASTSLRKEEIPFLIELELKDQFQIAKASEEYQNLVSLLPEFYVGKPETLTAIVRVMCDAAKKSMKEKKIHMGPWRKSSFMQMKWSGLNQKLSIADESIARVASFPHRPESETCLRILGAPAVVVT